VASPPLGSLSNNDVGRTQSSPSPSTSTTAKSPPKRSSYLCKTKRFESHSGGSLPFPSLDCLTAPSPYSLASRRALSAHPSRFRKMSFESWPPSRDKSTHISTFIPNRANPLFHTRFLGAPLFSRLPSNYAFPTSLPLLSSLMN